MFGFISAVCFFVPGLKYHRQRLRAMRAQAADLQDSASSR